MLLEAGALLRRTGSLWSCLGLEKFKIVGRDYQRSCATAHFFHFLCAGDFLQLRGLFFAFFACLVVLPRWLVRSLARRFALAAASVHDVLDLGVLYDAILRIYQNALLEICA